jgi:hypothetical protein
VENSDTRIIANITTRCKDVPNAADFNVAEQWYLAGLPNG